MTNLSYPYRIDMRSRTAVCDEERHIVQMMELILFTRPGERVNRPDFGSGLVHLVFDPMGDETVATTKFLVHGLLQKYLGDLIDVSGVEISADDTKVEVRVQYVIRRTGQEKNALLRGD